MEISTTQINQNKKNVPRQNKNDEHTPKITTKTTTSHKHTKNNINKHIKTTTTTT